MFVGCLALLLDCAYAQCQSQLLLGHDTGAQDRFGSAVAITGSALAVGAEGDAQDRGAAYVFERVGSAWSESIKLAPGDLSPHDRFGLSLAMDGDTLVVGAPGDFSFGAPRPGCAYVYERGSGGWVDNGQRLEASDGDVLDFFGVKVAVSGDEIFISATADDDGGVSCGAVYVFERVSGGAWVEAQKILPSNVAPNTAFGMDLSLEGGLAVVGSLQQSAYILERSGGGWVERQRITRSAGGFGLDVAIVDGDHLVIGAREDDFYGSDAGRAYWYHRGANGWVNGGTLRASDATATHYFGSAVAATGSHVLVGADWNLLSQSGGAYLFDGLGGAGASVESQILSEEGIGASDLFGGRAVAVSSEFAVVTAERFASNGTNSGAAFVFAIGRIGEAFCCDAGKPSSAGSVGSLGIGGSAVVQEQDIVFSAMGLPPHRAAYLLYGDQAGMRSIPGTLGDLCISGGAVRRLRPGFLTDANGQFSVAYGGRLTGVAAGSTWNFQVWYLDPGSGVRANMTNAVAVTFE